MKRILFVHQVSTIGGASYCMLSLLKGLDRSQFEPVVILRQEGPLAEEIRKLNIEVHFLIGLPTIPYNKSLLRPKTLYTYSKVERVQREFGEMLSKLKIDIVYLNNMMLYPYLKTAKSMGCKTIMHVREHWPKNEHQRQMDRARMYAKKYADAIVAINQYSASMFSDCSEKTTIIYDWINLSERYEPIPFENIIENYSKELKVILFTGGMARIKGTLEVVRLFSNQIKGDEYRLLMMGAGLNYEFRGLSGIIKKALMLTGWKPYGYRVTEIMRSDDRIVCAPPTYKIIDIYKQAYCTMSYFTIPHANLALAEAVAVGTVAIAPDTEESVEYSDDGKGAVLFKINNEQDLMDKFRYLTENYESVKKEVSLHSAAIQEKFSPISNINKLNQVCKSVIRDD